MALLVASTMAAIDIERTSHLRIDDATSPQVDFASDPLSHALPLHKVRAERKFCGCSFAVSTSALRSSTCSIVVLRKSPRPASASSLCASALLQPGDEAAARTRSDEEKMARLAEFDPMPHALRHDDCLTGFDADRPITVCLLQNHVHPTGNEVEDFVSVRMNFASMGRIPPHAGGPDR